MYTCYPIALFPSNNTIITNQQMATSFYDDGHIIAAFIPFYIKQDPSWNLEEISKAICVSPLWRDMLYNSKSDKIKFFSTDICHIINFDTFTLFNDQIDHLDVKTCCKVIETKRLFHTKKRIQDTKDIIQMLKYITEINEMLPVNSKARIFMIYMVYVFLFDHFRFTKILYDSKVFKNTCITMLEIYINDLKDYMSPEDVEYMQPRVQKIYRSIKYTRYYGK